MDNASGRCCVFQSFDGMRSFWDKYTFIYDDQFWTIGVFNLDGPHLKMKSHHWLKEWQLQAVDLGSQGAKTPTDRRQCRSKNFWNMEPYIAVSGSGPLLHHPYVAVTGSASHCMVRCQGLPTIAGRFLAWWVGHTPLGEGLKFPSLGLFYFLPRSVDG